MIYLDIWAYVVLLSLGNIANIGKSLNMVISFTKIELEMLGEGCNSILCRTKQAISACARFFILLFLS